MVRGLPMTLALTLLSLFIGFFVGTGLALLRVYGPKDLRWIPVVYDRIFRGIPLLVLLFIFAVGLLSLFLWAGSVLGALFLSAITALALRSAAYQSEIFRGAILSIDVGQMQAAQSIGMTNSQATRHVVLPQAFRLALPGWANEYAVIIKDTSLCNAIGLGEILYHVQAYTWTYPEWFFSIVMLSALIYFVFTYPVTKYVGESMTTRLRQLGLGGGRK